MLTRDKRGICCDYCNLLTLDTFTYYSVGYQKIRVCTSQKYTTPAVLENEYDMCRGCFDKFVAHAKKLTRKTLPLVLACDSCPANLKGDFDYYFVKVSELIVDTTGTQPGIKSITRDFLDLRICSPCFKGVSKLTKENHDKLKSQNMWS